MTTSVPDPVHCGIYHPGHELHPTQFNLSLKAGIGTPVTVTSEGDGWMRCDLPDGTTTRLWNHDPEWVAARVADGTEGRLRTHGVLSVDAAGQDWVLSVDTQSSPCPDPEEDITDMPLDEQAIRRGGFLVRFDTPTD